MSKVEGMVMRTWDILWYLPVRVYRIAHHVLYRFFHLITNPRLLIDLRGHGFWSVELVFLLLDLVGVSEVYETISELVKFNTRPLGDFELKIARELFGESLPLDRIRIDEAAFLGPRFTPLAYVGFYTINCWGGMSEATLVHELVHVWQYHRLGAAYIPKALVAQYSEDGYNYGGLSGLQAAAISGRGLEYFNLEQQGDIVADYYRIKTGRKPRWVSSTMADIDLFEELILSLQQGRSRLEQAPSPKKPGQDQAQ